MYTCDDSCADGLVDNNVCNEIDSLFPILLILFLLHVLPTLH